MGAVVGIDLGTTNTVVAAAREERPTAIPDESGSTLIPSIVSFLPSGAVLVGSAARERRSVDPRNTVYSIKRLIGRTWGTAEINEAVARFPFELREGPGRATFVVARGETYTLPEISAFVLRKAKSIAELELGEAVDRAVITVPASFNDLQRAATKVAGRVAGLEILRVLNEPTAAAVAFGHASGNRECIAVYDFGGGTFDFTLLRLTDDVFEVLATGGDTYLGGDDVDSAIVRQISGRLPGGPRLDPKTDAETFERLRGAAEQLKIDLSISGDARIRLADYELAEATGMEFSLTRAELDSLARPIIERTFAVCRDVLAAAQLRPSDVTDVLLVGGTTRDPFVRRRVQEFFGKQPHSDVDPHEVVALGAARQAMALTQLRATASGIPLPPSPATLHLTQQLVDTGNETERRGPPEPNLTQMSSGPGAQSTTSPEFIGMPLPEPSNSASAPRTQRFGSDYRTTIRGESDASPLDDLPARRDQPAAARAFVAEPSSPFRAEEPRPFGLPGVRDEAGATQPEEPAVPALAPRGRESAARTRRTARAPRDASPIASAIVNPSPAPRAESNMRADGSGTSVDSAELPRVSSNYGIPGNGVGLAGSDDSSTNLPAVRPHSTIALGKAFSSPMDVRDDLWDSPFLEPSSDGASAPGGSKAAQLSQLASPESSDLDPDLPIIALPQTNRSRTTSHAPTSAELTTPARMRQSHFDGHLASALNGAAGSETDAQSDADLAENEPTVVRRTAREALGPNPHRGSPLEPKLEAIDLPLVSGGEKAEPENRLSEAEIRARYGNLPLIVGGKRVGARESTSKAYTPPLGTRTQVTNDSTSDSRNAPSAIAMPEMDLPVPSAGGAPRSPEQLDEPSVNQAQRAGIGPPAWAKFGPAQMLGGGAEEPTNPRRPAFPPLTEKSTPIARPHHPTASAMEPREFSDNNLDDFVDPLTTEPTRPRFSVDLALAGAAVREDPPKSHRPSSRPSARQNIDELELPVPNLPPRQSTPSFGSPSEDFLSSSGALNPEKVRSPDESAVSSRRPEPAVRPPASAIAPEPGRLVSAGSTGRATIPFGQPPAPFAQGQTANPPSPNAGKSQVVPGPLDLELPPLVAPVQRAYSTSGRPVLLIDVTPLSLCVETVGGYVDVVVNRNTPVPCERTREYVTAQDNQQIVNIRVAQGESRLFEENVQLGEVQLSGIAAGVRGQTRIAVTFGIDADGLLHVRAMDVTSGKSAVADLRLAGVSGAHELAQPTARQAGKA